MKFIYKGIGLISILFIVSSCSFSKKQTMNKAEANDSCGSVLDFHKCL